ncbi:glycosyltransferase family 32 protein [Hydrogenimonas sp.]
MFQLLTHTKRYIQRKYSLNKYPPAPVKGLPHRPFSHNATIPKIIHQTYPTKTGLPAPLEKNIAFLQANNPRWAYRLYDDRDIERYIWENCPELLRYYKAIDPQYGAARADFFRYLVIYLEGGVYLDIKSSFLHPLDKVLRPDDSMLLSHWTDRKWGRHAEIPMKEGEFQQCFIIAAPGHPFVRNIIETIVNNLDRYRAYMHGTGKFATLKTTGPIAYTLAILPILEQYPHRIVDSVKDLGYVYSILEKDIQDLNHIEIFKTHYSKAEKPLVRSRPIEEWFGSQLRKVYARFVS